MFDAKDFIKGLRTVYANATAETQKYLGAQATVAFLKRDLDRKVAELRDTGQIEGKNEGDREARARVLLDQDYQALDKALSEADQTKASMEMATSELALWRDELRAWEVASRMIGGES